MAENTASITIGAKDATGPAFSAVDLAIQKLQLSAASLGKSANEAKLLELALKGASEAQLKNADAALKTAANYQTGVNIANQLKTSLFVLGAAAGVGLLAAYSAFDRLIAKAADFQDASEKIGDTASNVASLSVAAAVGGLSMESLVGASVKLTKNLTGVDDESKAAGAAIAALGLNLSDFKKLAPADQFRALGKALNGFADGSEKTAVAVALLGKSGAEALPFLKELGAEGGRQKILTEEQIRLADDYKDAQAKLNAELSLQAAAFATGLLPAITSTKLALADYAKQEDLAATAADILNGVIKGGLVVFQALAVLGTDLAFVFKGVGREIGATAAQIAALSRLEFSGFAGIAEEVRADGERARADLDKTQAKILALGTAAPAKFLDPRILGSVGTVAEQAKALRPKLKFDGGIKDDKAIDKAAAEAKARLALDIEGIRKLGEVLASAYSNAEKIAEAQRSAGLVDEADYYASRRAFINLTVAAQEDALGKELARLQAEKLAGKDKLDNDRKILDVQAKLQAVRETAITSAEILGIQESTALNKVAQAYREANDAAVDYLAVQQRQQAASLAGFGIGNLERERLSARTQINDKFNGDALRNERFKRDGLASGTFGADAQTKYDDELKRIAEFRAKALTEFEDYFGKRTALEKNGFLGAQDALKNYAQETDNLYRAIGDSVTSAFKGIEDALVNFVKTGKLDFKSLADSILSDLVRIAVQQSIMKPLTASLGLGSDAGGEGAFGSLLSSIFGGGKASGGPVSAGKLYQVNERGPELLETAGKQYLMMGSQGGNIVPNGGAGSAGSSVTQNNTFIVQGQIDRRTQEQIAARAAAGAQRALARNY